MAAISAAHQTSCEALGIATTIVKGSSVDNLTAPDNGVCNRWLVASSRTRKPKVSLWKRCGTFNYLPFAPTTGKDRDSQITGELPHVASHQEIRCEPLEG